MTRIVDYFERILHDVTATFGVTEDDVLHQRRNKGSVARNHSRAVLCWLMRELTGCTSMHIAALLGSDHTTVLRNQYLVQADLDKGFGPYLFALHSTLLQAKISGRLNVQENAVKNLQDIIVVRDRIIHAAALLYLAEAKSCSQKHRITPAIQDLREAYVLTLDGSKNNFDERLLREVAELEDDAAPREVI